MDKTLVESVWKLLLEHIQVVPSALYEEREAEAKQRISVRDPNDWPVVALALILDCPVWAEDQDFFGSGIASLSTDRVSLYLVSLTGRPCKVIKASEEKQRQGIKSGTKPTESGEAQEAY